MIGRSFGRYRVEARLGEGGMGSVWLAVDTLLGRPVALKLLSHDRAASEPARDRFVREARAASRLEHPGIASVYDAGEADGQVFIAYQRIVGETLAHRLASGPLPAAGLMQLAVGAAEALAHAHARGVLHRDLTAGNVMLRPDGSPVIVDFGLARVHDEATHTATGATVGTVPYLAPEQWRGEAGDERTDLWSLGVVLYLAATGVHPFAADSAEAVLYRVLNEEPVRPTKLRPDLPSGLERLVLRLLEKDPRDRLANAAELAGALRGLADPVGAPTVAPGSGEAPLARIRRWWRKQERRRLAPMQAALLALGLLVVLGGASYLVRRQVATREPVLAILPFRNASADSVDTQYIGEALGSDLTARLGRMGGFRVLPWETTSRYAGAGAALADVARDLGADFLLVGRYDGSEERIRVELELVEGRNGLQRWSDRREGAARELALMQIDLAARIARQLAPTAEPGAASAVRSGVTRDPDAYEMYLRGVNALHASSLADRALAEPMFRHALDLDSTYADAWVALGAVLVERYYEGGRGGIADLERAEQCFDRARAFDPGSGPALRGLIRVAAETEGPDPSVLALADSAGPHVADEIERNLVRAWACFSYNLPAEASEAFEHVLTLDPHNEAALYMQSFCLWWAGRAPEAVEHSKEYLRSFGEDPDIYAYCGGALAAMGQYDEATVFLQRSVALFAPGRGAFAVLYCAGALRSSGQGRKAEAMLDERIPAFEAGLAASPDNLRLRIDLANLYAARGDTANFEAQWTVISRELAGNAPGSGGEYPYTPFVLAQAGRLGRAREVIADFPSETEQYMVLLPSEVGFSQLFAGGRSAELASSVELLRLQARVQEKRASLRKKYPWLAGRIAEPAS